MNIVNLLRSAWAVFAGAAAGAGLSVGTDILLEGFHFFPPIGSGLMWWMLALALFYRGAYTAIGGYLTAKLAPGDPMRHVIILGSIGTLVSLVGTVVAWNLSDHWYPIALTLITLPCAWLGGKLQQCRTKN